MAQGDASALAALYDRHAGWLHARLARRAAVWAWSMQPGPQVAAWVVAVAAFVGGGALYVLRGARREN